jgi:UDP-3-O-[3-hydroxymyristoyl] glucosamine N-acyltransferase
VRARGVALSTPIVLGEIVETFGGELDAGVDRTRRIDRIGPSDRLGDYALSPVISSRGVATLVSEAPVLLVAAPLAREIPSGHRWIHPRADVVLAKLLAGAIVADAKIDPTARIAEGAVIFSGTIIGARVVVGANAVVGREGFGFVAPEARPDSSDPEGDEPIRIPHRAGVVIEDDVEIGALCTVDAGVLNATTIGAHTKLDAHVHVGHGVEIGARCRVAAQVGFAGSVVVEDDVWIGGQAGIADHVRIGKGARIAAKAGVIGDVPPRSIVAGYPAVERGRWLRGHARLYRR